VDAGLYDSEAFALQGVLLQRQAYAHPIYPQLAAGFEPYLSIADLLFQTGDGALEIIRSGRRWEDAAAQHLGVPS
jgi:hypothetical protein